MYSSVFPNVLAVASLYGRVQIKNSPPLPDEADEPLPPKYIPVREAVDPLKEKAKFAAVPVVVVLALTLTTRSVKVAGIALNVIEA
jgi:hypothetical protein